MKFFVSLVNNSIFLSPKETRSATSPTSLWRATSALCIYQRKKKERKKGPPSTPIQMDATGKETSLHIFEALYMKRKKNEKVKIKDGSRERERRKVVYILVHRVPLLFMCPPRTHSPCLIRHTQISPTPSGLLIPLNEKHHAKHTDIFARNTWDCVLPQVMVLCNFICTLNSLKVFLSILLKNYLLRQRVNLVC